MPPYVMDVMRTKLSIKSVQLGSYGRRTYQNCANLTGCQRGRIDNGRCWLDVNISMALPYNFLGYPVSKIGRQADLRTVPLRVAVMP